MSDVAPLDVRELTKVFGASRTHPGTVAANKVTFVVPRGGSLGVVGESGSGKSTIARMIVGLETATSGSILLDGVDYTNAKGPARRDRAAKIQMVFQDPYGSLDRGLTIRQAWSHAMQVKGKVGKAAVQQRIGELADLVRLPADRLDARPRELSGGQRQRVAIGRALAPRPDVVVLDESVSALDVSVQAQILQLLNDIRREEGTTLLFVSHDLAVIQEATSTVLVLYRGDVVEQGSTADVLTAARHPYTRLLLESVPGPGWDPAAVLARRAEFVAALAR